MEPIEKDIYDLEIFFTLLDSPVYRPISSANNTTDGLIKAYDSPYGQPVVLNMPAGKQQYGDSDCMFVMPCQSDGRLDGQPSTMSLEEFNAKYILLAKQPSPIRMVFNADADKHDVEIPD